MGDKENENTEDIVQYCPICSAGLQDHMEYCFYENCALWNDTAQACSFKVIGNVLLAGLYLEIRAIGLH